MTAVVATIDIPVTRQQVWDLVMDPHQLERWVTIHRELVAADDGTPRKGFSMEQRMSIRGAPVTVTWELDEVDAPALATWKGRGPARATAFIEYRLEEIDGGTRFHYTNDFTPPMGLLGRVASKALMGGVPDREANASLERLRELLVTG
ncbi:SRPBCC family protein [Patulibacter sp.]|uniref:SRPBCC family protein n=1 Tax=Patulibacter sp. TaxID=1912859 RepID=UPI00271B4D8F|nr:SRPBCC family protein [Patulibacter sp.]MDO9409208.1 SRPBCC family protein [Patulibacter sp.]